MIYRGIGRIGKICQNCDEDVGLFKEMTKKDKCVFWKLLEKLGLVFGVDIIVIYCGMWIYVW